MGVLGDPAPNPFLGATNVTYSLDRDGPVRLEVFDVLGRRRAVLVDESVPKGPHTVRWNGNDAQGACGAFGDVCHSFDLPGACGTGEGASYTLIGHP